MEKLKQLSDLFDEWKNSSHDDSRFYTDGIINVEEFEKNKKGEKILFIGKEANSTKSDSTDNYDFRKEWNNDKKPPSYPFARRISEWTFGILNNFPIYTDAKDQIKYLKKIAFMNLKKSGGKGTTSPGSIQTYISANRNKQFILEEINIINPDIIILCASFENGVRAIFGDDLNWIKSGYEIQFAKWQETIIIDFYHPSSRNVGPASYSLLQDVLNSTPYRDLKKTLFNLE